MTQRPTQVEADSDAFRFRRTMLKREAMSIEDLRQQLRPRLDRLYRALAADPGSVSAELGRTTAELLKALTTITEMRNERDQLLERLWRLRGSLRAERGLPASARLPEDSWLELEEMPTPLALPRAAIRPAPAPVAPVDDDEDGPDPELVRALRAAAAAEPNSAAA